MKSLTARDRDVIVAAAAAAVALLAARKANDAAAADEEEAKRLAFHALCAKLRPVSCTRQTGLSRRGRDALRSVPPKPQLFSLPSPWKIAAGAQEDAWIECAAAGCSGPGDLSWSGLLQDVFS